MSEVKDPTIKLFGRTIFLPQHDPALDHHHHQQQQQHEESSCSTSQDNKSNSAEEYTTSIQENDSSNLSDQESIGPLTGSGGCDTPKTPGADAETSPMKATPKEERDETNPSQEKTLKKPDKILPCPRCNSMDTKFCYYNNYNVNQPRHFCKKCQRYWTAGGTMRNVPVGSGRRKHKSSCASNNRHIMVSDALQAAQAGAANGFRFSSLKEDGTVLAFGAERSLCDLKGSAFNLAEQRLPVSYGEVEICRDHSNGLCNTRLNLTEKAGNAACPQDVVPEKLQIVPTQVPCFSGSPWPSQWNSPHCTSPATPHSRSPPVTFYPASPYWGYTVSSPWNATWLSPPPPSPNQSTLSSSSTSPTLGKHYRDGSMIKSSNLSKEIPSDVKDVDRSVVLSKTLRIGSPGETRKSSICLTLGIKSDNEDSVSGKTLFKAFQPVVDEKNHITNTSLILQANPAALSRSVNFHEST